MTLVRLQPAAPWSRLKNSTTALPDDVWLASYPKYAGREGNGMNDRQTQKAGSMHKLLVLKRTYQ